MGCALPIRNRTLAFMMELTPFFLLAWQGTELAPMSTTASQTVAAEYATRNNAQHSLLLRLHASTFMDSGCDISFLSGESGLSTLSSLLK